MRRTLQAWRSIAALSLLLAAPAAARADVVADWNRIAVQATLTAGRPGPSGVIDIAMVHAAVYDAVQAVEGRYEPYYVEIKGASGSPVAAAARAARDVLASRFPAQAGTFDSAYQQTLSAHGLSDSDPGVGAGARAAAGIIALRACDGSFPSPAPPPFFGGTGIGVWRSATPMAAQWLGDVTPFTMTRPSQFRADPPPALTSREYAKDYNEVKSLGSLSNSARTPAQTDLAHFWAGNYPVMLNQLVRDVSAAHVGDVADSSRLFALTSMAMADAIITSWNSKNYYVFWRPLTAIREGDNDGNPETAGDPAWQSLISAPPYPDHTSGANCITSAATSALGHFFGSDHMAFTVTTTNTGPTQQDMRSFGRFSEVAEEVVDARVYLGIHFRFADTAARRQGKQVAHWAFKNFLRPLDGGSALAVKGDGNKD
jgi:hypothetical protein